jgi:hypothetical protein
MPSLEQNRQKHDQNRHWIVVLVLLFLVLVTYFWTEWSRDYPFPGLQWLENHPIFGRGFNRDSKHHHLETEVWIAFRGGIGSHSERKLLLGLTALGFLFSYYLPLGYKRQPLAILTFLGIGLTFGWSPAAVLLAWHMVAYATYHPLNPHQPRTKLAVSAFTIVLCFAYASLYSTVSAWLLPITVVAAPFIFLLYEFLYYPLISGSNSLTCRNIITHSAILYIIVALLWNIGARGNVFPKTFAFLLFFWQWERLVLYHIDLKNDRMENGLSFFQYLSVFFSPAYLANVSWLNRIPLGYYYMEKSFLKRDKNRIIMSGVWLITLALLFFFFRWIVLAAYRSGIRGLDLSMITGYSSLIKRINADDINSAEIWSTLFYRFFNFYMLWTAIAHLKVGLWRLFGYDIDPYFNQPFRATNLAELWKRYSFHYREFLVQAFYYPVFLRYFKKRKKLRIFAATMSAAMVGNFIFHILEASLYKGSATDILMGQVRTLPYFFILGAIISLTQVWIISQGRKRRKPWTWGWKISLDGLALIASLSLFVLIRPLRHVPVKGTITDAFKIILAAFGINL